MLKKTTAILIAAIIICSLAGCGVSSDNFSTIAGTDNTADPGQSQQENTPVSETSRTSDASTESSEESSSTESKTQESKAGTDKTKQNSTESSSQEQSGSKSAGSGRISGRTSASVPQNAAVQNSSSQESSGSSAVSGSTQGSAGQNSGTAQNNSGAVVSGNSNSGNTASVSESNKSSAVNSGASVQPSETVTSVYTANTGGILDTSNLFTSRDLTQTADLTNSKTVTASDGNTVTITEAGVYLITGNARNFTVKVQADKEAKVQLVLDGLTLPMIIFRQFMLFQQINALLPPQTVKIPFL